MGMMDILRSRKNASTIATKALDKLREMETILVRKLERLAADKQAAVNEAIMSKTQKGKAAAVARAKELKRDEDGVERDLKTNRREQKRLLQETSTAEQAKILYKAEKASKIAQQAVDVKKMERNRDRVHAHEDNLEEMQNCMREDRFEGIEDSEDDDVFLAEQLAEMDVEDEELDDLPTPPTNLPKPPSNLPKPPTNQAPTSQARTRNPARKLTAREQKAREEAEELEQMRAEME